MSAQERQRAEEEQEVRRAQKGDQRAFAGLVHRYLPLVVSVAFSVVADSHVAEDVAQETFHKAFRRMRTLRDPSKVGAWLYGIARTTSVDWVRKHRGKAGRTADLASVPAPVDVGVGPVESAVRDEEKGIVMKALFELPDKYREVLVLKHMRDLPYTEVAGFMGTTVPAVESLLFRARSAFRDRLKRHGIGPARRPG